MSPRRSGPAAQRVRSSAPSSGQASWWPSVCRPSVWWLGVLALFGIALVVGARRLNGPHALTITELPGVPAWMFLAVLVMSTPQAGRRAGAPGFVGTFVPLVLGGVHVALWWVGPALLRGGASLLLAGTLVAYTVWSLRSAPREATTVAGLGTVLAATMLTTAFLLEAGDALAEAASSTPALVVDARGPGLAAVAVVLGMSAVERALPGPVRSVTDDVAGTVQVLLVGAGFLALVLGAGVDSLSLGVSAVGLHVIAVAVFVVRAAARITPREAASVTTRWAAAAAIAAAAYLGVLVHVAVGLVDERYVDSASIPPWLEVTIDLAAFAGIAGNGILGLALGSASTAPERRIATASFWLFNAGLAGAAVGAARALDSVAVVGWSAMVMAVAVAAVAAWSATAAGPFAPGQDPDAAVSSRMRSG